MTIAFRKIVAIGLLTIFPVLPATAGQREQRENTKTIENPAAKGKASDQPVPKPWTEGQKKPDVPKPWQVPTPTSESASEAKTSTLSGTLVTAAAGGDCSAKNARCVASATQDYNSQLNTLIDAEMGCETLGVIGCYGICLLEPTLPYPQCVEECTVAVTLACVLSFLATDALAQATLAARTYFCESCS